jgi:hypothetical protein
MDDNGKDVNDDSIIGNNDDKDDVGNNVSDNHDNQNNNTNLTVTMIE